MTIATLIEKLQEDISWLGYNETEREIIEHIKCAITLLKEHEAVTPYIDIDEAKCPICKVKLTRQELLGDNVLYEDFFDYCPHCGRPVKWDG